MASQEIVSNRSFSDGELQIRESYLNDELDLVTLTDSRDKTLEPLYGNRTVEVDFIFKVKDNRLQLSRIFANSENGGHGLDLKRSMLGGFRKSYDKRSLLDEHSIEFLKSEYPELRIDQRRIRDKIRNYFD